MDRADEERLLKAIKENRDALTSLLDRARSHWEYEDPVYRFYHQLQGLQRSAPHTRDRLGAASTLA